MVTIPRSKKQSHKKPRNWKIVIAEAPIFSSIELIVFVIVMYLGYYHYHTGIMQHILPEWTVRYVLWVSLAIHSVQAVGM